MAWTRAGTRAAAEGLGLAAVLGLVVAVAYLPHLDAFARPAADTPGFAQLGSIYADWLVLKVQDDYAYPVHVDENTHWAKMAAVQRAGSLRTDSSEGSQPLDLRGLVHERGFHLSIVYLQTMTGLPWQDLFRFLPALWAGVTALLLWAALRPGLHALAAAGFVALAPTTLRFLGPGFLVPIGFGLAWIAAALLLAPEAARRGKAGTLLLLVVVWAFFIHLIVGAAALLVVACIVPFARRHRRGVAVLAGVALLPLLALSEVFASDVEREVNVIGTLPVDFSVFDQLGVPFLALWAAGCAATVLRPPGRGHEALAAATLASIVAFVFIVGNVAARAHVYALYDRWHQPFALFAAAPAAYALVIAAEAAVAAARTRLALRRAGPGASRGSPRWTAPVATALLVAAGFAAVADAGVGYHVREPYYRVIDNDDWARFTWVAANVGPGHEVFLAHPWKAPVLQALRGGEPITYLSPGAPPVRGELYDAYVAGQVSAVDLVREDVSLVAAWGPPPGEGFVARFDGVWVLEPALAQELAAIRALESS